MLRSVKWRGAVGRILPAGRRLLHACTLSMERDRENSSQWCVAVAWGWEWGWGWGYRERCFYLPAPSYNGKRQLRIPRHGCTSLSVCFIIVGFIVLPSNTSSTLWLQFSLLYMIERGIPFSIRKTHFKRSFSESILSCIYFNCVIPWPSAVLYMYSHKL